MKRFFFFIVFSTILSNINAAGLPVGNPEDGNTIVSTSKKTEYSEGCRNKLWD